MPLIIGAQIGRAWTDQTRSRSRREVGDAQLRRTAAAAVVTVGYVQSFLVPNAALDLQGRSTEYLR